MKKKNLMSKQKNKLQGPTKKNLKIKLKLVNHIMINGGKLNSEKIITKSIKELQKHSAKNSKKLVQLATINLIPIFRFRNFSNKLKKKKKKINITEIPAFISNLYVRTSLALKFLLLNFNKNSQTNFHTKLSQELLLAAKTQGRSVESKNELQKQILLKQYFLKNYKWKRKLTLK